MLYNLKTHFWIVILPIIVVLLLCKNSMYYTKFFIDVLKVGNDNPIYNRA